MAIDTRYWKVLFPALVTSGVLGLFSSLPAAQVDAPREEGPSDPQKQVPTEVEKRTPQQPLNSDTSTSRARSEDAAPDLPGRPVDNTNRSQESGEEAGSVPDNPRASETRGQESGAARPSRNQLGIEFDQQSDQSLTIGKIEQDSRAGQAGLRPGDRIVSVDGRQIANPRQLQAYISSQPNRWVPLVVDRGGKLYSVQLAPNPSSGEGAWLGVYLQDNGEQGGAQVTSVYPASPAARAGIRTGDLIVSANGQKVNNAPDLIAAIDDLAPQSRTEVVILRGDQELKIPVVLGRRDSFVAHYRGFYPNNDQRNDMDDDYNTFPPHAMQLEHDRRNAEQHQRIENEIHKLREEIQQLRQLIEQKK